MNSRSRESSLKREKQKFNKAGSSSILQSDISENVQSNNNISPPKPTTKKVNKKLCLIKKPKNKAKRNEWRNVFYNHAKPRKDNSSDSRSVNKSDISETISVSHRGKGNESARNKVPILKKKFGRDITSSNNSLNDLSRKSSRSKHLGDSVNSKMLNQK